MEVELNSYIPCIFCKYSQFQTICGFFDIAMF